jgi:hypothetical protein
MKKGKKKRKKGETECAAPAGPISRLTSHRASFPYPHNNRYPQPTIPVDRHQPAASHSFLRRPRVLCLFPLSCHRCSFAPPPLIPCSTTEPGRLCSGWTVVAHDGSWAPVRGLKVAVRVLMTMVAGSNTLEIREGGNPTCFLYVLLPIFTGQGSVLPLDLLT